MLMLLSRLHCSTCPSHLGPSLRQNYPIPQIPAGHKYSSFQAFVYASFCSSVVVGAMIKSVMRDRAFSISGSLVRSVGRSRKLPVMSCYARQSGGRHGKGLGRGKMRQGTCKGKGKGTGNGSHITLHEGSSIGDSATWNFAFGANLSVQRMAQRGIAPLQKSLAVLHGWRLSFRHRGGYATLIPEHVAIANPAVCAPGAPVDTHGLLLLLQNDDFAMLTSQEYGYSTERVWVQTYDGTLVEASAFISKPSICESVSVQPSRRYLSLLQVGAREHLLDTDYVSWLDSLQVR